MLARGAGVGGSIPDPDPIKAPSLAFGSPLDPLNAHLC